ncbi:MAG: hypothetical protein O8C55_05845 [Candidatus Methanoperedens sp.]|nr:hypothetical protein [Candidatus Methanoperedens sp.]
MEVSFSSLALVNNPFDWAYDLEEILLTGHMTLKNWDSQAGKWLARGSSS